MKLIAMTDNAHSIHELATTISSIHHLVDYIHIREQSKTAQEILTLLQLLTQHGVKKEKLVVHDRLDIALLTNNQNIHLTSHSFSVKDVRKLYPDLRIGRSVHSLNEAKLAEVEGADYVLYGHCFETSCKQGKAPNGIGTLIDIKSELQIPVFAIGGITPERVDLLKEVQADGVAVMSGIFNSNDPYETTFTLSKKCQEYAHEKSL